MADKKIDCTTLRRPMPVVRISQAMKELEAGQTLDVVAADPAFVSDIRAWIKTTGHELLSLEEGDIQQVLIRKVEPVENLL